MAFEHGMHEIVHLFPVVRNVVPICSKLNCTLPSKYNLPTYEHLPRLESSWMALLSNRMKWFAVRALSPCTALPLAERPCCVRSTTCAAPVPIVG
eukprot:5043972-Amphidinium_carterae.1